MVERVRIKNRAFERVGRRGTFKLSNAKRVVKSVVLDNRALINFRSVLRLRSDNEDRFSRLATDVQSCSALGIFKTNSINLRNFRFILFQYWIAVTRSERIPGYGSIQDWSHHRSIHIVLQLTLEAIELVSNSL